MHAQGLQQGFPGRSSWATPLFQGCCAKFQEKPGSKKNFFPSPHKLWSCGSSGVPTWGAKAARRTSLNIFIHEKMLEFGSGCSWHEAGGEELSTSRANLSQGLRSGKKMRIFCPETGALPWGDTRQGQEDFLP